MADEAAEGTKGAAKKGGCLKVGLIVVGGLFGLAVIGTVLGDPAPSSTAPAPAPEAPALAITAPELLAAFAQNEVAAKARFDGQALAVSGTIAAIELDFADNPVIRFDAGQAFESVQAKFTKDDAAAVGALAKGQAITVTCAEVTEVIGNPVLDGCALP